jgi:hypothetical protein
MVGCKTFGGNGVDDGGINRDRKCEFDEMDQSYQQQSGEAQSTQRQLSRWVNNPRINPAKLYSPAIKAYLAKWQEAEIYLSFDSSQLWEEYCMIRLCVVHRGRALPL